MQIVKSPFLLLVEGKDDHIMLSSLLSHLGKNKEAFQIVPYGGKDNFKAVWKNISNQAEFEDVKGLVVFRDADESCDSALQSICDQLKRDELVPRDAVPVEAGVVNKQNPAISVGVYIMPDCSSIGALEALLLKSLSDDMQSAASGFVSGAHNHIPEAQLAKYKSSDKSKSYAYSALFENANFHDTFKKNLWDWDHPIFDQLKNFLDEFEIE
ncbi:DUF3226 domain-containing protein [Leucothrix arctica]|uniref:DUF4435 domain-containing protein n=1 Tax=Leucothrix arctica TaxID=1481894 RepID=A0A317CGQ3_9GAMM|nr:DUF3226 domain-containing protein [Leucothrix arctica]PWQ97321.1 hypothetical protein DKT75_07215 [Leucothrix arctica]